MRHIMLISLALLLSCSNPQEDRERLKEELKREILAELKQSKQSQEVVKPAQPKETVNPAQQIELPTGNVEGRMLFNGEGLADCKVKLVRILESESFLEIFKTIKEGAEFDAITDKDGNYRFENVPAGAYRMKWQPTGETGWIRRLTDKPDIIVEPDKTTRMRDTEVNKPLAPK